MTFRTESSAYAVLAGRNLAWRDVTSRSTQTKKNCEVAGRPALQPLPKTRKKPNPQTVKENKRKAQAKELFSYVILLLAEARTRFAKLSPFTRDDYAVEWFGSTGDLAYVIERVLARLEQNAKIRSNTKEFKAVSELVYSCIMIQKHVETPEKQDRESMNYRIRALLNAHLKTAKLRDLT